eukprot:Skav234807  [mRNA]  locus=scaffold69:622508:627339:- [translate_table: standard]
MEFVGRGRGDYDKQQRTVVKSYQCRPVQSDSSSQAYDCDVGFDHWREAWTVRHQRWCCFLQNRGCAEKIVHRDHYIQVLQQGDAMHGHFSHRITDDDPMASYDPASGSQIYDCTMGIPSWQSLWSQSKKVWCCDHSEGEVMRPLRWGSC